MTVGAVRFSTSAESPPQMVMFVNTIICSACRKEFVVFAIVRPDEHLPLAVDRGDMYLSCPFCGYQGIVNDVPFKFVEGGDRR